MRGKLVYAAIATLVVTGASAGASAVLLKWVPRDRRKAVERAFIAPGQALYEKLEGRTGFRKLRKEGEKTLEAGKEKLEDAAEELSDRLPHAYNIGAWAATGFLLCWLTTVLLGIASLKAAVGLGLKVTFALALVQAAVVLAGLTP